jgi:hypothetical protein
MGTGLIFSTVRTKTPAAPPSNRSGVAPGVTVKVIAAGAGRESANAKKGTKITAPATMAAARTDDVTNFPRSNIFVSYFQKDRSNLTQRTLREIVPQIFRDDSGQQASLLFRQQPLLTFARVLRLGMV